MLSFVSRSTFTPAFGNFFAKATKEFIDKVNAVIDERVRPVLQMDGGDIVLKDIVDGIVTVQLQGHCSGCPSRRNTLNAGILGCLQEEFGEKEIVDIKEVAEDK